MGGEERGHGVVTTGMRGAILRVANGYDSLCTISFECTNICAHM